MEAYLPAGTSIEDVLIIMSALSAGSVAVSIWFTLLYKEPGVRRAKLIAAQRTALRSTVAGPRRRQERLPTIGLMRKVVDRLNLLKSGQAERISLKLMRAGWRSKDAIIGYLFAKLALPLSFGVLIVFFLYGLDLYDLQPMTKLGVALASVIFGAYLPDIVIKNKTQKRQHTIGKALPDALDLMVICAEAGLSLDATLNRVSQEMELACLELADELGLTGLELGFLPDRRKALQNLALRVDLPVVRGVVNTLMQAEKYGTPLAQSLRIMSAESRNERVMKAEEKAARLPALLTVPMIIFVLPPLFVVLLGRAILNLMDAFAGMS
ncbi:MAG: type II secretion system F family protein [Proteobacteria bacterium]|nr:type II secretion system F family protein [Pseudomonadota bacterium]MCH8808980.1 type II secretion system F family protein [Pseudomonadota bacterium]